MRWRKQEGAWECTTVGVSKAAAEPWPAPFARFSSAWRTLAAGLRCSIARDASRNTQRIECPAEFIRKPTTHLPLAVPRRGAHKRAEQSKAVVTHTSALSLPLSLPQQQYPVECTLGKEMFEILPVQRGVVWTTLFLGEEMESGKVECCNWCKPKRTAYTNPGNRNGTHFPNLIDLLQRVC